MSKVRLGDVAIEVRETSKCPEGLPVVGLEHLLPSEITLTQWSDTSDNTFNKLFHKGQILFGRRRAYLKKAAVAPFDGVCSGDITVIAAKPERLLTELLPFIISNDAFFDYAMEKSAGSLSPRVKWAQLAEYEFDLPELEEQQKLANLLWAMERTRKAYQDLLIQADELVKSQFVEMFGDPQGNPYGYRTVRLSDIAEYFNGLTYKPENVVEEGTIVLRSSNIQNSQLDFADTVRVDCAIKERLMVQDNDILMCSRNGSAKLVGKVALIKGIQEPMSFGAFMMIIRSQYYGYLMTYFQMDAFRQQIRTGATTTINQITGRMLDDITIPLPPKALVEQFTAFVEQVDKSKLAIRQALESLEKSRSAIMTKVFG